MPNAAADNIITISGRYFGDTPGQVMFWNGSDFSLAGVSPSARNANCTSNWSSEQIIVVVPAGAVSGPLRVIRADMQSDETNDDQGPEVSDLIINTIRKPGLCLISPDHGYLDAGISYHGINFSIGSEANFGNYSNFIQGKSSSFVSDLFGTTSVPLLAAGKTTTFVSGLTGDLSNYLKFTKDDDGARGPYIISFEPTSGAPGQYITIYGSGFGSSRGSSAVYFGDETGFEANYGFPDICADSVWRDDQVIIKVPASASDGNYRLTMVVGGKTIDTSSLSQNFFRIDRSSSLLPSLCRISPSLGDVGAPVSLWGEHFDSFNTLSRVRFYNNKDASGAGIDFWDLDPEVNTGVKPYRVDTSVPPSSVTGLVRVVKGGASLAGNGLNFRIGSCLEAEDPDSACSPDICCPEGTYKSGRCVASAADCFMDVPSSVYEWDFNTGLGLTSATTDTLTNSCAERSRLLSLCEVELCPNSPGECSPFDNVFSALENSGSCSYDCSGVPPCTAASCRYDSSLDRCVSTSRVNCSLPSVTTDAYGNDVEAHCVEYQDTSRRVVYIDQSSICPNGWVRVNAPIGQGGSAVLVCVDLSSSCTACGGGFDCVSDGSGLSRGSCAAPADICPPDSVCQSDGRCKKVSADECQCCCRKANANQDCCAPLTCEGTCGSDRTTDTGTYGSCSGCRIERGGVVDQTASDAACNCSNSFGKYCDAGVDVNGDGKAEGVCRDCAELSDDSSCSNHSTACCVDAVRKDICTSRQYGASSTKDIFSTVVSGGISYCGYYSCSSNNTACDATPDIGPFAKDINYFRSLTTCQAKCSSPVLLGLSCTSKINASCDESICSLPGACLNENGRTAVPGDCGVCCCNPTNDQCSLDGAPNLRCQPDVAPCDGPGRGLCCGCSFNSDCVPVGSQPTTVGCGTDTCCRARPQVDPSSVVPADGSTDACTNGEIRAEFNQLMNAESLRGNVIVIGQYATPCPDGTVYLAADESSPKRNVAYQLFRVLRDGIAKAFKKVLYPSALASDPPLSYMNYCAITGNVDAEHVNPETGPTILKFRPNGILDSGRKYFVIIKGDPALDNTEGVKSYWGIGMNTPAGSVANRVDNRSSFNGIVYPGAHIWSFTTRPSNGGNKGICDIERVSISPDSYLFSTDKQDLEEDDTNPAGKKFDIAADVDKKFTSQALSAKGEILFPASGYSWDWTWDVVDDAVADLVGGIFLANGDRQLIRAKEGISDRRTDVTAQVNLIDSFLSPVGDGKKALSVVYVFLCANPWPNVDPITGTWRPWMDDPNAMDPYCITGAGTCLPMRYELYYCRDSGNKGTADDLPVLSSGVTRGKTSDDLLKESYFFRQTPPVVESINLQIQAVPRGGEVELNWQEVTDPSCSQTVSKYKVYYGVKSGAPYASSFEVPVERAPYRTAPVIVKDLAKDKTYYFAVTAVYGNGEESDYSEEVSKMPSDILPPARPTGLSGKVSVSSIPISVSYAMDYWSRDKTEKIVAGVSMDGSPSELLKHLRTFDFRWGSAQNSYPNVVSISAREALVNGSKMVVDADFATGTTYYFVVSATRNGNTSTERAGAFKLAYPDDKNTEAKVEDYEILPGETKQTKSSEFIYVSLPSGVMNVKWTPNTDDAVAYRLYWGDSSGYYGEKIEISGRDAAAGQSYKEATFNYISTLGTIFMAISSVDAAGNESGKSAEVSVRGY